MIENNGDHTFYTGFVENISSGGLFIATFDLEPTIGDKFEIVFQLPSGGKVEVVSEVAWIRLFSPTRPDMPPGFGVQFLDLSNDSEKEINEYISRAGSMFFI